MSTATPRRRRRWLQFSLRILLTFVLLVSLGMSWFSVKFHRARQQREAVEAIERLGGQVKYNYEPAGAWRSDMQAARWLQVLLGEDLSHDLVFAFSDCDANYVCVEEISDEHIKYLSQLTTLEYLCVDASRLADSDVEQLKRLKTLKTLRVLALGHIVITHWGRMGETFVNPEAAKELQEALPECNVLY